MRTATELNQLSEKYRGEILNEISWLEKLIDTYIASHFTKGDEQLIVEMQLLLFGDNRMTFENKKQVFQWIAENKDHDWYYSYRSMQDREFKTKDFEMNADLDYVIQNRNIFAHCLLDDSKKAQLDDDNLTFFRFKNDVKRFSFDDKSYRTLLSTIKYLKAKIEKRLFK